jgi:two-component system LytT family response regulator
MLRAIIIDDESNGLKSLTLLLGKFFSEVKVVASSTSAIEGIELINNYRPNVVFLDINMPNLNGFQLLNKLDFRDFYLVFTTAHREYALMALKERAVDYLLKPIGSQDIRETIDRIRKKMEEKPKVTDLMTVMKDLAFIQNQKIALPGKNKIEYVTVSEIVYIEANSNSSNILTVNSDGLIPASKSLKEYEDLLCIPDTPFIRIHNSYIINVNYATKYIREDGGYVILREKKTIPVSKQKKDEFLKMINHGIPS